MVKLVIDSREASLGEGMRVKRILPFRKQRMVGPFIFMDHGGPVDLRPDLKKSMDVLPHPHIGLSTVSYLFSGQLVHRDSLGVKQIIRPGEVNWMTAGSGISHSERFEDPGILAENSLELIQTWVALPEKFEEANPSFKNYKPEDLAVYTDTGVWMRLIAGDAYGLNNHVETLSPLFYLHVKLDKNARYGLPQKHSERAIYIAKGSLEVSGTAYIAGQMLVFEKDVDPVITTKTGAELMVMGGEPLGERFIWWNFVSSRKERIEQAKEDWKQGRIILPPNDDHEFIPLPEDPFKSRSNPSPEPLS
ncbi:pirin family protein [Antarcticibacterium arcticum]|uniref:Pirin family protein n=1 Tax=Antarcticibacterium arcticum TaxID=2585771 RepID=A0A5B8YKI9_9FLAO|nr:pirin family protein [Antarcticibacterium arcticum]QED37708.1 pirin family protein [Antarcticibacterium arcticum]